MQISYFILLSITAVLLIVAILVLVRCVWPWFSSASVYKSTSDDSPIETGSILVDVHEKKKKKGRANPGSIQMDVHEKKKKRRAQGYSPGQVKVDEVDEENFDSSGVKLLPEEDRAQTLQNLVDDLDEENTKPIYHSAVSERIDETNSKKIRFYRTKNVNSLPSEGTQDSLESGIRRKSLPPSIFGRRSSINVWTRRNSQRAPPEDPDIAAGRDTHQTSELS